MDRETMRRMLLDGVDRLIGRRFGVSAADRALAQAVRVVYETDDEVIDKILAHYRAPARDDVESEAGGGPGGGDEP